VVRLKTSAFVLDGKVIANGQPDSSSGAGGSVRVDADSLSGSGEIHADGGINDTNSSAGGGRVAVYYKTNSIPITRITAATLSTRNTIGAPGTVYLRQIDAGNNKVFDELIVDNLGLATNFATVIAAAGSG